jgi:hypothetical protein
MTSSALIFGDKGLGFVKPLGEFVLGQMRTLSRPDDKLGKGALAFGVDRFVEFARAGSHRRRRLIRIAG